MHTGYGLGVILLGFAAAFFLSAYRAARRRVRAELIAERRAITEGQG